MMILDSGLLFWATLYNESIYQSKEISIAPHTGHVGNA